MVASPLRWQCAPGRVLPRSLRYSKEGAARVAFNESAGSNGC